MYCRTSPLAFLLLAVCFVIVGVQANPVRPAGEKEHSEVQADGRLEIFYEIAEFSAKSGSLPVPILIKYSSGVGSGNSVLPAGWSIPFIDSAIQQNSELTGQFLHPDGQTVPFNIDKDGVSISGAEGLHGTIRNNLITINAPGYTIVFKDGRVKQLTYDNSSISWEYKDKVLTRIVSDNDELVISNKVSGPINELQMKGRKNDARVTYAKGAAGGSVLDSLGMNMVSEIKGFSDSWVFQHDVADKQRKMKVTSQGEGTHDYGWDASSGDIRRVDSLLYDVTRFSNKTTSPQIRTFSPKSGWQVVQGGTDYDAQSDILTNHLPNGEKEHLYYVNSKGERRVRKKVLERANGELVETYRAQFGADGALLKDRAGDYERRNVDGRIQVWKNGAFLYQY